jgi:hypothetical protein
MNTPNILTFDSFNLSYKQDEIAIILETALAFRHPQPTQQDLTAKKIQSCSAYTPASSFSPASYSDYCVRSLRSSFLARFHCFPEFLSSCT